jgi:hypothetical protein
MFSISSEILYSTAIVCFNYIKDFYDSIKRLILIRVTVDEIYGCVVAGKVAYLLITVVGWYE